MMVNDQERDLDQEKAIDLICSGSRLVIITGGPGTGKTTTLKKALNDRRLFGKDVVLAAPTGKAAKRMTEVVGGEASTIHRLTGFTGDTYGTEQLSHDVIILDGARRRECVIGTVRRADGDGMGGKVEHGTTPILETPVGGCGMTSSGGTMPTLFRRRRAAIFG
jgi:ATP-dependent exoDNAse (exonuclease V) alpha subunit